jgi:hypothetical protein
LFTGAGALDDLTDVTITTASSGQVLKYNGTVWANAADSTFSGDYNDLTNKPTIPTNTNQLTNGSNYITLSSLSATGDISYNNTTGVISYSMPTLKTVNSNSLVGSGDITIAGLPIAGTTNQILVKNSNTDYDTTWSSTITSLSVINSVLKGYNEGTPFVLTTTSGTISPDATNGNVQLVTINGNITINGFTNPIAGQSITLIITQDTTGSRLLTSTMKFAGGIKTLSTAANSIDVLSIFYDGTNYLASLSVGFA